MTEYEQFINSDEYENWRMADKMKVFEHHVIITTIQGTSEENSEKFKSIQRKFPTMEFSTYVTNKVKHHGEQETWTVRRFISKEISGMYCTWPPYYIRNGGKVL